MLDDFGENKVTVKKEELLKILRTNKENHREIFIDAQKGYRAQLIAEIDKMLADAREGKKVAKAIALVEPEDHTKDYERVIKMLEMSQADTIQISEHQFQSYVMDDWGWRKAWIASNSLYSGKTPRE